MVSVIYASLAALFIVWLSLGVIKVRQKHSISVGDGDNTELQTAMGAHSNAIEYIPLALLMLFALEYNGANLWLVHVLGIMLILSRALHAHSLFADILSRRVLSMQLTIVTLVGLAVANVVYLPYNKLFS